MKIVEMIPCYRPTAQSEGLEWQRHLTLVDLAGQADASGYELPRELVLKLFSLAVRYTPDEARRNVLYEVMDHLNDLQKATTAEPKPDLLPLRDHFAASGGDLPDTVKLDIELRSALDDLAHQTYQERINKALGPLALTTNSNFYKKKRFNAVTSAQVLLLNRILILEDARCLDGIGIGESLERNALAREAWFLMKYIDRAILDAEAKK